MKKQYKDVTFEELQERHIDTLTPIMKKAFDTDTQMHIHEESGGPGGYDDGSFLRSYGLASDSTSYTIFKDDQIIGAIILWIDNNTQCNYLGDFFIDVNFENRNIGKTVWEFIEQEYPQTKVWKTDTPAYSLRNHYFYVNKCGFHIVHIKDPEDIKDCTYQLEKIMK